MTYPERWYGEKYESFHRGPDGQRIYRKASEYSAQIRKDIKEAVAASVLPKAKYRVTCENFSGGCSVNVEIQDLPNAWVDAYSPEAAPSIGWRPEGQKVLSKEAKRVQDAVEKIHRAYNFDGSNAQFDHYDVNYYGHVEIESEWSADWRARQKAKKASA